MYSVTPPMPKGMGIGHLDRLSQNTTDSIASRSGPDISTRWQHHASTDELWLSYRARNFVSSWPIDLPSSGDPGGDSDLVSSIRKVGQFLKENSKSAESPFGMSVQNLMRGALHLVAAGGTGDVEGFPPEDKEILLTVLRPVQDFLESHPRVARSPFGEAVAKMGRAMVSTISANSGDQGPVFNNQVIQFAGPAKQFLEAHPKIADMPLGQAVEKLINGVLGMGEGNDVDPDIQNLAKRIGHFVAPHPRLAESEFGQLISGLIRGILALDTTVPPDVEPHAVGDIRRDVAVPAVSHVSPVTDFYDEADLKKAA